MVGGLLRRWMISDEVSASRRRVNIVVQAIQLGCGDDGACGDERITLLMPVRDLLFNVLMRSSLVVILNVLPHQTMCNWRPWRMSI